MGYTEDRWPQGVCMDNLRGTGRTTRMLLRSMQAALDPAVKVRVVARNEPERARMYRILEAHNIPRSHLPRNFEIITPPQLDRLQGYRKPHAKVFIDHALAHATLENSERWQLVKLATSDVVAD